MDIFTLTLILLVLIPSLFIVLVYFIYSYHKKEAKKSSLINILKNDTTTILSNKIEKDKKTWLQRQLNYAGFTHFYSEAYFLLVTICLSILTVLFFSLIVKSLIILTLSFLFSLFIPFLFLKKIIYLRTQNFNAGLKLLIEKLTSMMKSGAGFEHSLQKAVLSSESKLIKSIFNIYLSEKNILGEEKCFQKMFNIIQSKELRIFYLTISIGKHSGGKFSTTLERLKQTLSDQEEIEQQIASSTQEVKIGTYIIIALVVFIYILINQILNGALNEHFLYSNAGNIQLFLIILWIILGLFINNFLTRIKG